MSSRRSGFHSRPHLLWASRRVALLGAAVALLVLGACERRSGSSDSDEGLTGGRLVFSDDFERAELGEQWRADSDVWRIEEGAVAVQGARNAPLWLDVELPEQVRLELDATASHDDGDLKFEIFANGRDHESGYVLIFGGWSNQVTCIARLDEHGEDRLDARRHNRVVPGTTYRLAAVRTDDRLRWYIDGELVLTFDDVDPLRGPEHAHFALNNWMVPVRYDNIEIYDLSQ